ncbi:hypothetical protein I3260_18740 [Photobacterium damselae]|uniref:hypothetical protein n=1 Tax=Gammaproteobacteria TaxID=1236 RepID=UPI001EDFB9C8|nr:MULTISPECIES: hypothetical protein [Gammaproteobacteria]MCG3814275.1 hypothetical protein [Photobacterium damselae]MCG3880378.1 hypothetical protein [Psychrobacter sp. Ps6]
MSDSNTVFNDYLKLDYSTKPTTSYYHRAGKDTQRAIAVSCALELIQTKLSTNSSTSVKSSLECLPVYADLIQEALKTK